jgi:hypothetical protein
MAPIRWRDCERNDHGWALRVKTGIAFTLRLEINPTVDATHSVGHLPALGEPGTLPDRTITTCRRVTI